MMNGKIKITNFIVMIFTLSLFAVCSFIGNAYAKASFTSSASSNTMSLNIMLVGPGANTGLAATIQNAIEDAWDNGSADYSCHNIDFDINVEFTDGYELAENTDASMSESDFVLSNVFEFPTYSDYEVWYVPDIAPGTPFRPAAAIGDYATDMMGTVTAHEQSMVYAHEAGHVFGLQDQYTCTFDSEGKSTCTVTEEKYEDNFMNDAWEGSVEAVNFEDLMSAYEAASGNDVNPCLKCYLHIDDGDVPSMVAELSYYATMYFDVTPDYAITTTDSTNTLGGTGTGSSEWVTVITSDSTLFTGFESTVDPYDMTITGDTLSGIYTVAFTTTDWSQASKSDTGVYRSWSDCSTYFPYSTGTCTGLSSNLDSLMIDTSAATSGMTCTFSTSLGDYTGTYYLEITSIQG